MAKNPGKMTLIQKVTLGRVGTVPMTPAELKAAPSDLEKLEARGSVSSVDVDGIKMFYLEDEAAQ